MDKKGGHDNDEMRVCSTYSPDNYFTFPGPELIKKKVKELLSMANRFPEGKSYIVFIDTESSIYTFKNWPTRFIFSSGESETLIKSGIPLLNNKSISDSLVKDAYAISIPKDLQGKNGCMSWDQTAVLCAVRGHKPYFKLKEGQIIVNKDGSNNWINSEGNQFHLVFDSPKSNVESIINDLMMHTSIKPV